MIKYVVDYIGRCKFSVIFEQQGFGTYRRIQIVEGQTTAKDAESG
jgi:hypothetical protein